MPRAPQTGRGPPDRLRTPTAPPAEGGGLDGGNGGPPVAGRTAAKFPDALALRHHSALVAAATASAGPPGTK